ncbi:hypothetical protein M988_3076 [Hafnia paralvei ATCC 29927]|uniref:hypothetical protein n=1 Tax=Hafnia paralvei TaxID=546367 RepID=UPI0007E3A6CB|nr:hypothetical protein [Hafnia paralvei]MDU1191816.1 hypothetical protein [Enterobacteriaceae bacterium]MDU1243719.1 hypothetical protein [Enterobacteriaceae bacterium]OAT39494.1 hypothetical protein M988_3076 [Hafnia paralvei ATCC 29927]HCU15707.1 hypothetical protein [Hafnia paralvei]
MTQPITDNTLDPKYIAVIISSIIAVLGWLFSSYINTRAFRRAETSKLKDKIASLTEVFFDALEEKMKSRTLKESELDDFISGKISIIELHLNHLERKININLITASQLSKIRSEPYDYLSTSNGDYKNNLTELKFSTLEMIEESYTSWYFKNENMITNIRKKISTK